MKLLYIGGGFVGTCSAAVLADAGHQVTVFDIDKNKVDKLSSGIVAQINSCLQEDKLAEYIIRNTTRLNFTAELETLKNAVDSVDAIFLCLPTPENKDEQGKTDMKYYVKGLEMLADILKQRKNGSQENYFVIINKSTIPIDAVYFARDFLMEKGVKNFGNVSNPEFLAEGRAIEDSVHPPRIVVGADNEKDFEIMRKMYSRWIDSPNIKYIEVAPKEAAAGKLLSNFILFNRLANCFGVVGRVSEYFEGINFEELRKIISSDPRIGSWGWYDSAFAGGSCFIKDAASLAHQLKEKGAPSNMVDLTLEINNYQLNNFYERTVKEAGLEPSGKTVVVLGAAFKQGTNDTRYSAAIGIIENLIKDGVKEVRVYDPAANNELANYFKTANEQILSKIKFFDSTNEIFKDSVAVFITTDWQEFKALIDVFKNSVKPPYVIADGRRMWSRFGHELASSGYSYLAVGSPYNPAKK